MSEEMSDVEIQNSLEDFWKKVIQENLQVKGIRSMTTQQLNAIVGLIVGHIFYHPWTDSDWSTSVIENVAREFDVEIPLAWKEVEE